MADPRPLFYVTAAVFLGLIAWVASVWVRPGRPWAEPLAASSDAATEPGKGGDKAPEGDKRDKRETTSDERPSGDA